MNQLILTNDSQDKEWADQIQKAVSYVLKTSDIINSCHQLIQILEKATGLNIFNKLDNLEKEKLYNYLTHDNHIDVKDIACFIETIDRMDTNLDHTIQIDNLKKFIDKIKKSYDVNEFIK